MVLAVAVAAVSTTTSAQETYKSDRSDMFGQEQVAPGEALSTAQSARKLSITNATASQVPLMRGAAGERETSQAGRDAGSVDDGLAYAKPSQQRGSRELAGKEPPSEFQKFIFENTGKSLPIFGSKFFSNAPSTFAPVLNSLLPSDNMLGPGDELLIRGWGTIDIDYRATIDRNGTISIPTIGSIVLAGVKAGEAESVVRNAVARLYKGVTVNVSFGQLRAITVYMVGQAHKPGTYTVSSTSTLITALFAAGGPNANGSMRRVQVKRAGKVAAELDLYAFIAKGDKSGDIRLQDGDSIFIPPAGGLVALTGKVNSPAIYELKSSSDTIESLLDYAGGLPVVADPRRAFLERIDADKSHPRSVEDFALDSAGLKRVLKNGDVLNVNSITPDFSNAVVLRGNVDQPIRAPFRQGMRVGDLIPNREYLISRNSTKRQNNTVGTREREFDPAMGTRGIMAGDRRSLGGELVSQQSERYGDQRLGRDERDAGTDSESIAAHIGGLIDEINWDYAVVERINRSDLSVKLIPFNLGNIFSNPSGPDNVQLQPGDTVTIFSQQDVAVPMDKRRVFVRVEGEVKVPGVYQMSAGETLQSLLAKSGGPTSNAYLFGTAFYREEVRKEQEENLAKAANRMEVQMRNEQSKGLANMRALSAGDAQAAAAQKEAEIQVAKEAIARFRQLKPTGRIAFGLEANERSFARLPQIKLENGDRLVIPARPAFVHIFGAVNVEASPLWRPNTRVKDYLQMAGVTSDADVDNIFIMRVDGTVVSNSSRGWFASGIGGLEVMPGDSIVIPEKFDKETAWTKFTQGTREWAQIFANFGLGAAAIKTLRN
jgi:protein involved in polysaccharide export with SLBB domain